MPGKPKKPPERLMELLAYQPNGQFFSHYRCDATELLAANKKKRKRGPTWVGKIRERLSRVDGSLSYLDMATIGDPRVSAVLLTYTPDAALIELHRNGELVAVASLHRSVSADTAVRFAKLVQVTFPMFRNDNLAEDVLMAQDDPVMFLVQAPTDAAYAHWMTIYEGALLMMGTFVCEPPEALAVGSSEARSSGPGREGVAQRRLGLRAHAAGTCGRPRDRPDSASPPRGAGFAA